VDDGWTTHFFGPRRRSRTALTCALLSVALVAAANVDVPPAVASAVTTLHGDTVPTVDHLGPRTFTRPGPFAAGETTLVLPSDHADVEVFYPAPAGSARGHTPATYNVSAWLPPAIKALVPKNFNAGAYPTGAYRGLPVAPGRFPLVVFVHGYSGFRDQSTFLTSWLARWGFVVVAPDLPDNDLTAVLSGHSAAGIGSDIDEVASTVRLMGDKNDGAGMFHGHLDLGRVAAVGHSLGGAVSEGVAAADPRVTTFIGMAGATVGSFGQTASGPTSVVPDKPGMLVVGTSDGIVQPATIATAFTHMVRPKRLVTLHDFGHLVFADICQIGKEQGGLLAIAAAIHVSVPPMLKALATDGCVPPDTPVTEGWPAIRQVVVAQLRHVFGFDRSLAGLTGLIPAFPGVVAANVYAGPH